MGIVCPGPGPKAQGAAGRGLGCHTEYECNGGVAYLADKHEPRGLGGRRNRNGATANVGSGAARTAICHWATAAEAGPRPSAGPRGGMGLGGQDMNQSYEHVIF